MKKQCNEQWMKRWSMYRWPGETMHICQGWAINFAWGLLWESRI